MSLQPPDATVYEICVYGHLDAAWADWFAGLTIEHLVSAGGMPITRLVGPIPDQSALTGLLLRLSDINMPLISVNPVD